MVKRVWCNRCNKYHVGDPVDPKKLIEKHASDIAKHIDQEVIEKLLPEVIENLKAIRAGVVAYEFQKGQKR